MNEHTTVTYFRTWEDAQAVADVNQLDDTDGWSYRVEHHNGRRAYFVAVYDETNTRLGPL